MSIDKSIKFPSDPKVGDVFCVTGLDYVPWPEGWVPQGCCHCQSTGVPCRCFKYVGVPEAKNETLQALLSEQAEVIEQLEKSLEAKQRIIDQKCAEMAILKGQIAGLNNDLAKFSRAHSEQCEILANITMGEIDTARDIVSMGKELGKLKGECVRWEKMYKALTHDYDDLGEKTASLRTQIRKRDEIIAGLRGKMRDARRIATTTAVCEGMHVSCVHSIFNEIAHILESDV